MPRVVVMPTARDELDHLIETHSLPADAWRRVGRSIELLARFPRVGKKLKRPGRDVRYVIGPWRWMVVVYSYDELNNVVSVITIEDGRSRQSVLGSADRP